MTLKLLHRLQTLNPSPIPVLPCTHFFPINLTCRKIESKNIFGTSNGNVVSGKRHTTHTNKEGRE